MADAQTAAAEMMKNPQFIEMFQKAMGEDKIPDEKDPGRDEWLKNMQTKLAAAQEEDAKKKIEEPVSDAEGQWMWIVPEPGFCIKCSTTTGDKVFINICKHPKIAEPIPLEPEDTDDSDTIKFKIPLSCGQLRTDKDKAGKSCKVYDVVVNPNTVVRCSEDSEFRRFLAALSMTWIKQKSEQHLNAEEFKNINIKCKGKPDLQRIRLSEAPKAANAMGDEIKLPGEGGSNPTPKQGGAAPRKLVEEISPDDGNSNKKSGNSNKKVGFDDEKQKHPTVTYNPIGSYDWGAHQKPGRHPHFREQVPQFYDLEAFIPVQTIKEVDVRVLGKKVDFVYVDSEDGRPFMSCHLPFSVSEDPEAAKFIRKKQQLILKLRVELTDEVEAEKTRTNVSRCAVDEEQEAQRKKQDEEERLLKEQRERYDRIRKEEEDVMNQRKELVANLNAMSEGQIPPSLKEELDKMPNEQLSNMMMRIDGRVKQGDSIDTLLEKLPNEQLDAIVDYIRSKLGLEPKKREKAPEPAAPKPKPASVTAAEEKGLMAPAEEEGSNTVEFNFAKKAEQLCGVLLENRYLFALDH